MGKERKEKWVTPTQKEKGEEKIEMSDEERKEYLEKVKEEVIEMKELVEKGEAKDYAEAAIIIEGEKEGDSVDYIKEHIQSDLSLQPDVQREVVNTLLALLKIRKSENYMMESLSIVSELEKSLRVKSQLMKKTEESFPGFISLHETKKAAFTIEGLSDKEAEEVKQYLEGLMPEQEDTLEQHMSKELGLASEEIFDPDKFEDDVAKTQAAMLEMFNSGNLENFELRTKERVPDSKITEIITGYYTNKGYTVESMGIGAFIVKKEGENLVVSISNWGGEIMVSTMELP